MSLSTAIVVILLILIVWIAMAPDTAETFSKIRRTIGVYNDANETQVAAGVVDSTAIMDYTHTYWDGNRITSCDECPNGIVCPECPQYANSHAPTRARVRSDGSRTLMPLESMRGGTRAGRGGTCAERAGADYVAAARCVNNAKFTNDDSTLNKIVETYGMVLDKTYDTDFGSGAVAGCDVSYNGGSSYGFGIADCGINLNDRTIVYDLDADYVSSRESMGACGGKGWLSHSTNTHRYISDATRGSVNEMQNPKYIYPAMEVLYNGVLGITTTGPSPDHCEYITQQGYVHKLPCVDV